MDPTTTDIEPCGELRVDVEAVLSSRLPRHSRYIPRFAVRWLERVIRQRELNGLLEATRGSKDAEFCRAVLEHLDVSYSVDGPGSLGCDSRVIIVSNHPLGALDGIIMIDWITRAFGRPVAFVVNDLLMAVKPLEGTFIPINKFGRQSRDSADALDRCMEADGPVIVFPAGLVSRKHESGGIRDLKWQKMFVNKAIEHHRDIIPVYFDGQNSSFFYNFAKLRTRVGLKFNIEMIFLPREIFRSRGANFKIAVGDRQPWLTLKGGRDASDEALRIKNLVYEIVKK